MKIAYLAWGSLKWNPENLPITSINSWIYSSLELPLEFSRISDNKKGRLTLVIDEKNGTYNKIWYAISTENNLDKAINKLKKREKTTINNIAYINLRNNKIRVNNTSRNIANNIINWMKKNKLDAVVWTDLKSNWEEIMKCPFTNQKAFNYFKNSTTGTKLLIVEYIFKASQLAKIKTSFSEFFIKKLQ